MFQIYHPRESSSSFIMKTVILLALIAVVAAQMKPCTPPAQWEAQVFESDKVRSFGIFKFSYDATNMRTRKTEQPRYNPQVDYFDTLTLHQMKKQYKLNLKTRVCAITPLDTPFVPASMPDNSTYYGQTYLGVSGSGSQGLKVTLWGGKTPEGGHYWGTFTSPACAPVRFGYNSERTGNIDSEFFDITLGIADPKVFTPPAECVH